MTQATELFFKKMEAEFQRLADEDPVIATAFTATLFNGGIPTPDVTVEDNSLKCVMMLGEEREITLVWRIHKQAFQTSVRNVEPASGLTI